MSGEHLDAVVELEKAVKRVEQALGTFLGRDREVRTSRVSDEERVAREDEPGLASARVVDDREAAMLGPVPRRVDDAERDGADRDLVAVVHRVVRVVDAGVGVDAHRNAVLERQTTVPRDVIRVGVRFDGADDPEPTSPGFGDERLDRKGGIDDDGDPRFLVTDQIARASQVVIEELVEDHEPTVAPGPAIDLEVISRAEDEGEAGCLR